MYVVSLVPGPGMSLVAWLWAASMCFHRGAALTSLPHGKCIARCMCTLTFCHAEVIDFTSAASLHNYRVPSLPSSQNYFAWYGNTFCLTCLCFWEQILLTCLLFAWSLIISGRVYPFCECFTPSCITSLCLPLSTWFWSQMKALIESFPLVCFLSKFNLS